MSIKVKNNKNTEMKRIVFGFKKGKELFLVFKSHCLINFVNPSQFPWVESNMTNVTNKLSDNVFQLLSLFIIGKLNNA